MFHRRAGTQDHHPFGAVLILHFLCVCVCSGGGGGRNGRADGLQILIVTPQGREREKREGGSLFLKPGVWVFFGQKVFWAGIPARLMSGETAEQLHQSIHLLRTPVSSLSTDGGFRRNRGRERNPYVTVAANLGHIIISMRSSRQQSPQKILFFRADLLQLMDY